MVIPDCRKRHTPVSSGTWLGCERDPASRIALSRIPPAMECRTTQRRRRGNSVVMERGPMSGPFAPQSRSVPRPRMGRALPRRPGCYAAVERQRRLGFWRDLYVRPGRMRRAAHVACDLLLKLSCVCGRGAVPR